MSSLPTLSTPTAGSATKTNAVSARAPAPAAPVETARPPAPTPAVAEPHPAARSMRAAAIRSRDWRRAWLLALTHPSVGTFEGLAAHSAASLDRALRWCLAAAALGALLPAGLSVWHGAKLPTLGLAYVVLAGLSAGAFAAGTAVAGALAAHLEAYGLGARPQRSARQPLADAAPPAGAGVFRRAVYDRLAFACAAYAAPMLAALGVVLAVPDPARGLLLLGLSVYGLLLTVLAVRAVCRVGWQWAAVAGVAGGLCAMLILAAVAGAWVGFIG